MPETIGFIGFGEVASTLARPIADAGVQIRAFDVLLQSDRGRGVLEGRAGGVEVAFRPLEETVSGSQMVLSAVTTQAACEVAQSCAQHLRPGQTYVDLNSTAPFVKSHIGEAIAPSGADFVEGAILGAIGTTGARTRILLGGERGEGAAAGLTAVGLNAVFYSLEIGKASTFKMLRSVFSKGMEALLLEFLIAGRRAGIEADLWSEAAEVMDSHPFKHVGSNWVRSHAVAYERRYHEVAQVADTMRQMGLDPVITSATEAFFRRSLSLDLGQAFSVAPESMEEVVDAMERKLR